MGVNSSVLPASKIRNVCRTLSRSVGGRQKNPKCIHQNDFYRTELGVGGQQKNRSLKRKTQDVTTFQFSSIFFIKGVCCKFTDYKESKNNAVSGEEKGYMKLEFSISKLFCVYNSVAFLYLLLTVSSILPPSAV